MASIYKPPGRKKYIIEFRDENGRRRRKTGATDKAVSQRIANDLENKVALRKQGLIDPAAERFAKSAPKTPRSNTRITTSTSWTRPATRISAAKSSAS